MEWLEFRLWLYSGLQPSALEPCFRDCTGHDDAGETAETETPTPVQPARVPPVDEAAGRNDQDGAEDEASEAVGRNDSHASSGAGGAHGGEGGWGVSAMAAGGSQWG
jgi:hypothetical protein